MPGRQPGPCPDGEPASGPIVPPDLSAGVAAAVAGGGPGRSAPDRTAADGTPALGVRESVAGGGNPAAAAVTDLDNSPAPAGPPGSRPVLPPNPMPPAAAGDPDRPRQLAAAAEKCACDCVDQIQAITAAIREAVVAAAAPAQAAWQSADRAIRDLAGASARAIALDRTRIAGGIAAAADQAAAELRVETRAVVDGLRLGEEDTPGFLRPAPPGVPTPTPPAFTDFVPGQDDGIFPRGDVTLLPTPKGDEPFRTPPGPGQPLDPRMFPFGDKTEENIRKGLPWDGPQPPAPPPPGLPPPTLLPAPVLEPFQPAEPVPLECPTDCPKWRVWGRPQECTTLVTGPSEGTPGGRWNLYGEYDHAVEAYRGETELRGRLTACHKPAQQANALIKGPDFTDPAACRAADLGDSGASSSQTPTFARLLGLRDRDGKPTIPADMDNGDWWGINPDRLLFAAIRYGVDSVDYLVKTVMGFLPANAQAAVYSTLRILPFEAMQRYTGADLGWATRPHRYAANHAVPNELPSAADTLSMYGSGLIDDETALCWAKANAQHPKPFAQQMEGLKSPWTPEQALYLRRRGEIGADDEIRALRRNSFLRPQDAKLWDAATQQIPALGDILRYMVRDAADDDLAKKFGLDDEFGEKFTGQLEEFARWQNVHPDYARMEWRAHWQIPSPQQLYEMYHRLRKDPQWGGEAAVLDDVTTALAQQDIAPYWREKLLAISFRPLTRTDAQRAYQLGSITRSELHRAYTDEGYSDPDADKMVAFTDDLWVNRALAYPEVAAYVAAESGWEAAAQALSARSMGDGLQKRVRASADRRRAVRLRKQCLAGIRARYRRGELDNAEAVQAAIAGGTGPTDAADLVNTWECAQRSRDLKPTVSALTAWWARGLIDGNDLADRLERLGYTKADTGHIMTRAWADQRLRDIKAAEAAARAEAASRKSAEAAARRRAKEIEAEARRQNAAMEKAGAAQIKRALAAAGTAEKVLAGLTKAAAGLAKRSGAGLDASRRAVESAYGDVLRRVGSGGVNYALGVLEAAVQVAGATPDTLSAVAQDLIVVPRAG